MNFVYSEADEYEADFAAAGPIMELLDARVLAARDCGA